MKKQLCVGILVSFVAVAFTASASQEKEASKKEVAQAPKADPRDQQISNLSSRVIALQQANEALTERLGRLAEQSVPLAQVGAICKANIERANEGKTLDDNLKIVPAKKGDQ